MIYTLDSRALGTLLQDAAALGSESTLVELGILKAHLSQSEAFRTYGRANVERWIKEGLIEPIKDGPHSAKVRLDRVKLKAIANTANRAFYKRHIEQK